ncbi:MAG: flagellar biosynthesis anti-sigma factor FlgM [Desulfovibrio sp.]|nr:flagellar biosynthesis anti-sigma factor FlgM [Desulfovibrio sp.]MCA1986979.1 flagellar biosynthesis anti-sigma factor FlgM [Desulfovibrio sp.]
MDVKKLIAGAEVSQEETSRARQRDTKGRQKAAASSDRVTLSARRVTPEDAAAHVAEQAARAEKVRLLKEAVRTGAYRADIREVARNLLFSDFKPLE